MSQAIRLGKCDIIKLLKGATMKTTTLDPSTTLQIEGNRARVIKHGPKPGSWHQFATEDVLSVSVESVYLKDRGGYSADILYSTDSAEYKTVTIEISGLDLSFH